MVGEKSAIAGENLQSEGRRIQVNAQSAAQFKDVGQTKLAHKVGQKKLRYWRKIFARGCNKISVERRIRSHNGGKEAR
jgi:predicted ATPase